MKILKSKLSRFKIIPIEFRNAILHGKYAQYGHKANFSKGFLYKYENI